MTRSDYQEKKEGKIERFQELAIKNGQRADQLLTQAHQMAEVIPFGQPILVGHHSERRDRNYRDKIHNKFGQAFKTQEKAEYYERRAESAASNNAISSDDPDRLEKLKDKLARLEKSQEIIKAVNKIIRSKKIPADKRPDHYRTLGLSDQVIELLTRPAELNGRNEESTRTIPLPGGPEYFDSSGFRSFCLTNNNGNIRRIRQRIEYLEREAKEQTTEYEIGPIRIVDSVEENRVMITFPFIPDEYTRGMLKGDGFRWSPTNRAWQAYRSAAWKIPAIIRRLTVMPAYFNPAEVPRAIPSDPPLNLYILGYWFNECIGEEPTGEEIKQDLFYDGLYNRQADWISPEFFTTQKVHS